MDELIGRLVADVGVDRTAAETAVGIILDFPLMQKAAREKVGEDVVGEIVGAIPALGQFV